MFVRRNLRQTGRPHEEAVTLTGGTPAFVEGPDDEGLTTAAVTSGEDAGEAGGVLLVLGLDVAAGVAFDVEGVEKRLLGSKEAHGEQDELRGEDFFGPWDLLRAEVALFILLPLDIDDMDGLHIAVGIAFKVGGSREIDAGIVAELGSGFLLAVVHLVGLGPLRPRIVRGAAERRFGHDLKLRDGGAAVTDAGADAVGAGVATADDDDVLPVGGDVFAAWIEHGLGVGRALVDGKDERPVLRHRAHRLRASARRAAAAIPSGVMP